MKIFFTYKIPEIAVKKLEEKGLKCLISNSYYFNPENIGEEEKEAEAIVSLLSHKIDKYVIKKFRKLKIVANYAVGYNNIDVKYCKENKIYVTNTPGVLTDTTADLAFALMLSSARFIPQAHNFTVEGKFRGWEPELFLGYDIYGKKLGIIGMGRIGSAIAKRAKGFNMKIYYYSRRRKKSVEKEIGAKYLSLEEISKKCDFIVLSLPLTDETYHIIDEKFLTNMKKTAFLINIARGPVVDEKVLIKYLEDRKIAGAGFDVYENEPEVPKELKKLNNVVLLPHIGSASFETRSKMAEIVADNIIDVLIKKVKPKNNVY